jgi:hypothetical protein
VEPALANGVDTWWRGVAALHGAEKASAVAGGTRSMDVEEPQD